MRRKKKLKNIPNKILYQAGMTWWFGRILGHHTSQKIYGQNIFST
jgi:hypothetical protein